MFVNQVDGTGKFFTSTITADDIIGTNITATKLFTTTFSPVNVNATNIIATDSTITTGNFGTINTATINSVSNNLEVIHATTTNTVTLNVSNSGTIQQLTSDHIILPSNDGLSSDGNIIKLGDQLQIKSGADGGSIAFINGLAPSTVVYESNHLQVMNELLFLTELTDKKASIQLEDQSFKFIADKNGLPDEFGVIGNDIEFLTALNGDVKLKIPHNSNTVEVHGLNVFNTLESTGILCDHINTEIISSHEVQYRTQDDLSWTSINRTPDNFNIYATGDSTETANINFYTDDGSELPKLKISKNSNEVVTIDFKTNTLTANSMNCTTTITSANAILHEATVQGHFYVANEIGKKCSFEHNGNDFNFYAAKNDNLVPSNIKFHTDAGGLYPKLIIHKDSDAVETRELDTGILKISNEFNQQASIKHTGNDLLFIGDTSGLGSDINFFTNAGTGASKLKILKDSTAIEVQDINCIGNIECQTLLSDDINTLSLSVNGLNVETEILSKQDTLIAGSNITIGVDNVISASGAGLLTGDAPITVVGTVISVEEDIEPTLSSTNLVNSGNIKSALNTLNSTLTAYINLINTNLTASINTKQNKIEMLQWQNNSSFPNGGTQWLEHTKYLSLVAGEKIHINCTWGFYKWGENPNSTNACWIRINGTYYPVGGHYFFINNGNMHISNSTAFVYTVPFSWTGNVTIMLRTDNAYTDAQSRGNVVTIRGVFN